VPSHRRPARHNTARPPHPSSASSRCELRGARTAGESLDLLGQVASHAAAWSTKGDKVRLLELEGEDDGYKAQAHGRFDHTGQAAPFRRLRRRCGRLDRLQVGQVVGKLGKTYKFWSQHSCCAHNLASMDYYVKGCRVISRINRSGQVMQCKIMHGVGRSGKLQEGEAGELEGRDSAGADQASEAAHPSIR